MFVYTVGYVDGVKKQAWLVSNGNTKNMEEKSIIRIYGWRLSTMYRNSPIPQKIRNEKTEITTRMVSVIEQVAELPTAYISSGCNR